MNYQTGPSLQGVVALCLIFFGLIAASWVLSAKVLDNGAVAPIVFVGLFLLTVTIESILTVMSERRAVVNWAKQRNLEVIRFRYMCADVPSNEFFVYLCDQRGNRSKIRVHVSRGDHRRPEVDVIKAFELGPRTGIHTTP